TGILKRPILYLSDFFEKHRSLYYDNLMRVRTHNDIEQWIKFFLTGVNETAEKGILTFDGILQLQRDLETKLKDMGARSGDAFRLINYLYQKPLINAKKVSEVIEKTPHTAYKLIDELEKRKILEEITGGERGRLYVFRDYLNLFEND